MNTMQLVIAFRQADASGHILDITSTTTGNCVGSCMTCPAHPACSYIGTDCTSFEAWCEAYKAKVLPYLSNPKYATSAIRETYPEYLL